MAEKTEIVLPVGWKSPSGYSVATVLPHGRPLHIAGMVAWDENNRLVGDEFSVQFAQVLRNVRTAAEAAGSATSFIGRLTIYVADRQAYLDALPKLGAIYREVFGRHYPAMALVEVSALLEEGALLEIEATGVVPDTEGQ